MSDERTPIKQQVRCPYCNFLVDARDDGNPDKHAIKEVTQRGLHYRACKGGKRAETKA